MELNFLSLSHYIQSLVLTKSTCLVLMEILVNFCFFQSSSKLILFKFAKCVCVCVYIYKITNLDKGKLDLTQAIYFALLLTFQTPHTTGKSIADKAVLAFAPNPSFNCGSIDCVCINSTSFLGIISIWNRPF